MGSRLHKLQWLMTNLRVIKKLVPNEQQFRNKKSPKKSMVHMACNDLIKVTVDLALHLFAVHKMESLQQQMLRMIMNDQESTNLKMRKTQTSAE